MPPDVHLMYTSIRQRCSVMINAETLVINVETLKRDRDGPKEPPLARADARLPFTFLFPFSFTLYYLLTALSAFK